MPDFDEEEYINQPEEDEDVADATVVSVNVAINLAVEAGRTVVEAPGRGTAEETREDAEGDAAQDLPLEL